MWCLESVLDANNEVPAPTGRLRYLTIEGLFRAGMRPKGLPTCLRVERRHPLGRWARSSFGGEGRFGFAG